MELFKKIVLANLFYLSEFQTNLKEWHLTVKVIFCSVAVVIYS